MHHDTDATSENHGQASINHRTVVLDTETTGVNPDEGHRIVEIGAVELIDGIATDREFHAYINPCRSMPIEAFNVHGLSAEFLRDKPLFDAIVDDFLAFIGDSPLVIHNAAFDMRFLNAEMKRCGRPLLDESRAIDTLAIARQRFPGQQANLDALCRRFGIDITHREKHGAIKDARLLAEVYLELNGGRQRKLDLKFARSSKELMERAPIGARIVPAPIPPTEEEFEAHAKLIARLKNPLWIDEAA
jgi:DNA polymerase-3 subunit epsilon